MSRLLGVLLSVLVLLSGFVLGMNYNSTFIEKEIHHHYETPIRLCAEYDDIHFSFTMWPNDPGKIDMFELVRVDKEYVRIGGVRFYNLDGKTWDDHIKQMETFDTINQEDSNDPNSSPDPKDNPSKSD